MRKFVGCGLLLAVGLLGAPPVEAACCYFSAQNTDILQPAQKVFITWDPVNKVESFTVQPKFEGNALDFGMVIPTPSQPKLHEMPRDFFKHLAVNSILKQRVFPQSKIVTDRAWGIVKLQFNKDTKAFTPLETEPVRKLAVTVLETGVVGSLDYKIIKAERADDLYQWLKDNKYSYAGDQATLDFYVRKNYFFTVMKIDTMQMKKNKDGSYSGDVTPTRFQFTSDKLVYPLKITQISVKDKTEALFYVQAPYKVDLPGDMTYQYTWVPLLESARGYAIFPGPLAIKGKKKVAPRPPYPPGGGPEWLAAVQGEIPGLLRHAEQLGFSFVPGKRPEPNSKGRTPTMIEWARKLTADDIRALTEKVAFTDTLPGDVDEGFTAEEYAKATPERRKEIETTIRERLQKLRAERPLGYLVREVPAEDLKGLAQLAGHLREGLFITKFRKIFTRGEMNDDLTLVAARLGEHEDRSEYEEILPASPP